MFARFLITIVVLVALVWLDFILNGVGTIGAANMAGLQFQSDNGSYLASQAGMRLFSSLHVPLWLMLLIVVGIWWKPLKRALAALAIIGIAIVANGQHANAYYDKSDYAEPYFVLPNESAFWLPDVGDNKTSQVQFGSLAYFEANKIAAKRFVIPHTKLENSGLFSNYYVPAGRLIIVDRTPYSREWVKSAVRGTSARDQSFPCQSLEGINITLEISIGVSVQEENAAKYLYRFGIAALDGNRADPNVVFTSVLHGRSLTEVMDTVGRNKVQALMCNEVTTRTFDDANAHAIDMMTNAKAKADEYLKSVGITLDYLGWAGTMEFDKDVQQAINDRYTAEKLRPVLDVMKTQAALDVARKWDGHLPSSISGLWLLPSDLWNAVLGWFTSPTQVAKK